MNKMKMLKYYKLTNSNVHPYTTYTTAHEVIHTNHLLGPTIDFKNPDRKS